MKFSRNQIGISILVLGFFRTGAVNASTCFTGTAVGSAGSGTMVGSIGGPGPDAQVSSANLSFLVDDLDLDLIPDNDPDGFKESILLSYWDWNGSNFDLASPGATIKTAVAPSDFPDPNLPHVMQPNLVQWGLGGIDLISLNKRSQE